MQKSSFLHDLYMSMDLSEEGERKRKEEAERRRLEEREGRKAFITEYTAQIDEMERFCKQAEQRKESVVFNPVFIKPIAAEPA